MIVKLTVYRLSEAESFSSKCHSKCGLLLFFFSSMNNKPFIKVVMFDIGFLLLAEFVLNVLGLIDIVTLA